MEKKSSILLLLSGGYDSIVSGFLLKENGYNIQGVHFSQEPFTDNQPEVKALQLAEKIGINPVYIINIGHQLLEISEKCRRSYYFIHMKRFMYRIATKIALSNGIDFLATGESLGQVSSQTLHNLKCLTDSLTEIPILRPLIWFEKQDIIKINRELDCYEISSGPESCDRLGPKNPETHANLFKIQDDEKKVDISQLVEISLTKVKKHSFQIPLTPIS
ncbi:MAG: putative tRNA sulfurtransferase [Candidatus Heimdallarchaeota archaeon LC_3]|nr:MAG: putative tRNA sulfurtransferase [Candidatus Heimdallarchaeota archaeon LC_3]